MGQISIRVTKVTPEIIERVPYFDISLYVDGVKYEIGEEIQVLHKGLGKFGLGFYEVKQVQ